MAETKIAPFNFTKEGIYYFSRRIPADLQAHYTASRIAYSLRTRSGPVATARAIRAAQKLDGHWYHLRIQQEDLPGRHLLRLAREARPDTAAIPPANPEAITLSEAVGIYLRLKGGGKPITFKRAAERSCRYVIDVCGDKDVTRYTRRDANAFRDDLIAKGLAGSSIARVFRIVRAVTNFAASEAGIEFNNPFAKVYYDMQAGVAERNPIPEGNIKRVQAKCRDLDDDLRWLVALVSDTGMRLAEAAGLLKEDLKLDGPIPHAVIREHPWRRLKTPGSSTVPLVGSALWAAQRIVEQDDGEPLPSLDTIERAPPAPTRPTQPSTSGSSLAFPSDARCTASDTRCGIV